MSYPSKGSNIVRYLEITDSSSSVSLATSATLITNGTVVAKTDGVTSSGGVTYLPAYGWYRWDLTLNMYVTAARTIRFYAEYSFDGITWLLVPNSARTLTVTSQSDGQVPMGGELNATAPVYFRAYLWASGTASAIATTIATGVVVPAMRLQIGGPQ